MPDDSQRERTSLNPSDATALASLTDLLTAIIGHLSFAREVPGMPDAAHCSLQIAEAAAARAARLARRLTTLTKGGNPMKTPVPLKALLDESVSLGVGTSNIRTEVRVADPLCVVEADEGQLSLVFHHVIVHAVEGMPQGGKLTLCAGNAPVEESRQLGLPPVGYLKIAVIDEGGSFRIEEQTHNPGGAGIGLDSCHSIVASHGGHMTVTPGRETGSTFTIYLPCMQPVRQESDAPQRGRPPEERS